MRRRLLITGCAGFIGCNVARQFSAEDWDVIGLDNLSRTGSSSNLAHLEREDVLEHFENVDLRDVNETTRVISQARPDVVLHLAAQVAVTLSVQDPRFDFENNVLATFNLLEAIRSTGRKPLVIFSSTNKVYGCLENYDVSELPTRYSWKDGQAGINEAEILDFHSPYGCSKGAADQYVRDYFRIFRLPTVVARQSCIYGPNQFGIEDQGWVAWFTIAKALGRPITVFGTGKQVRDVLHVDDLARFYMSCIHNAETAAGEVFNVGGGAQNTLSVIEHISLLSELTGERVLFDSGAERAGDQKIFISDNTHAKDILGWEPKIEYRKGVADLDKWVHQNLDLISGALQD